MSGRFNNSLLAKYQKRFTYTRAQLARQKKSREANIKKLKNERTVLKSNRTKNLTKQLVLVDAGVRILRKNGTEYGSQLTAQHFNQSYTRTLNGHVYYDETQRQMQSNCRAEFMSSHQELQQERIKKLFKQFVKMCKKNMTKRKKLIEKGKIDVNGTYNFLVFFYYSDNSNS